MERHRQQEFDERRRPPGARALARLKTTLGEADAVLGGLGPETLLTRRAIQGYDVTVLQAIYHVVEHFSMHTGQDHRPHQDDDRTRSEAVEGSVSARRRKDASGG